MVQDLIDHGVLNGKSRSEVLELLGEPDYCGTSNSAATAEHTKCDNPKVDWFGYKVVTLSRCYFWECRMNVNFSADSYRVEELTVSD
jgi:hypothetical protein